MPKGFLYIAVSGLLMACSSNGTVTAQKHNFNSYLGKQPPELVSSEYHWLGWQERVTLEQLKGKVIWLQFNF